MIIKIIIIHYSKKCKYFIYKMADNLLNNNTPNNKI